MSQRANLTPAKAWAHGVLDDVRAGGDVPESEILWALWITGDLFGSGNAV